MSLHFDELFRKKLQKVPHFVKKHENSSIWPKLCNFLNKLPCLCISMNFSERSCKKCLISWKSTRNNRFHQNLQLFEKTTIFLRFVELYGKKLQKLPHFVKKHENSSIWPKLWHFFEQTTMLWCFDELLSKSLQKVAQFMKKQEKSSIWPKLCKFSNKPPCLCILMNFSGKSCKKCLISWESTKNHRFGQNFLTFRTNYHVFAFRWTFQEKVAESVSFREKARKTNDLAKTFNFSSKLPCLGIFMNFSERSCKKCLILWESTRNNGFHPNLQLFEKTTMFLRLDELYGKKLKKLPHFVKKQKNSSIWPKLCNFSSKLPCFGVLVNFSAKRWKKWLISWKMTKNHRFGLNLQLFEETTMFRRFCQLFSKKLQKVAHFVKEHEKSSIWPKLATFRANYHVSAFWWTFQQKVSHFVKKHEKSSIWPKLTTSRTNYHVSAFWWTFQQKVSHFVKKHEKSSIWPKLTTSRTNYHVSAFWSAFQQKVVKSIVGAYQAQAIITGFATSICAFHLCRDWGNDFWNYVSRSTGVLG